ANVLFQVVNDRWLKKRPMVLTTNKPVEGWGKVLHDPDLAEAILDRVLERGRVLPFRGPSYRTRHLRSEGVPVISGKAWSEFREPTGCPSFGRWQPQRDQFRSEGLVEFVQVPVIDGTRGRVCSKGTVLCRVAPSGFEPLSQAPKARMLVHYTTGLREPRYRGGNYRFP
ncbi:IS21 family transposase, partial [mine drainage metagenome]